MFNICSNRVFTVYNTLNNPPSDVSNTVMQIRWLYWAIEDLGCKKLIRIFYIDKKELKFSWKILNNSLLRVRLKVKVRLHGTRQAARLAGDMLQRDLLRGNSIYMEGSSRARLLHIIHVSAFLGLFWGRCSSKKTEATARDSMCRAAIISSNLYCRPGSQQSRVCCVQRVAM